MECHACGAEVVEGQKFCHDCGESLRGVTDSTLQMEHDETAVGAQDPSRMAAPAGGPPEADEPREAPADTALDDATQVVPADDPPREAPADTSLDDATQVVPADDPPVSAPAQPAGRGPVSPTDPTPAGATLPLLSDLPTQEVPPRQPLPDPTWAPADSAGTPGEATLADLGSAEPVGEGPAGPITTEDFVVGPAATTDEVAGDHSATTVLAATGPTTDEIPVVFDGSGDVQHFPPAREPFKLRLMFVLGFFGAIATLMSSAADVTDLRTSAPVDGINIGITTLSDIGINLPIAGYVGGAVMAIGGLFACYGFRWGAGIAGGGGLAVAGWAGLAIGLAEVPIAVAESITRTTTTQQFTLTVTRDLGYWLIVASGAIGLLVFLASLRLAGTGGHRSLNPWVAAVGAVSTLILAAGPLIPEGDASFEDNFRSPNALIDLPTAYFGGRLGQVALIAFAGVVGFLLVRAYGLGLVFGGISVGAWMWASALLELEEDPLTNDEPLGIAAGNFGAGDTVPHGVTTVGMVLTLLMLLIAAVLAIVQFRRARPV